MRGGSKCPYGFLIGCHFSQDHATVTKILDFINKHSKLMVVKPFFYYLYGFFRNLAETDEKLQFFCSEKHKIDFFQFFCNKSLLFCFKSQSQFSWGFFWCILHFCKSKIGDSRIFASDFFHFDLGHFRDLLRPKYGPQWPQWGLKF